jgi:hypothetical protein
MGILPMSEDRRSGAVAPEFAFLDIGKMPVLLW